MVSDDLKSANQVIIYLLQIWLDYENNLLNVYAQKFPIWRQQIYENLLTFLTFGQIAILQISEQPESMTVLCSE